MNGEREGCWMRGESVGDVDDVNLETFINCGIVWEREGERSVRLLTCVRLHKAKGNVLLVEAEILFCLRGVVDIRRNWANDGIRFDLTERSWVLLSHRKRIVFIWSFKRLSAVDISLSFILLCSALSECCVEAETRLAHVRCSHMHKLPAVDVGKSISFSWMDSRAGACVCEKSVFALCKGKSTRVGWEKRLNFLHFH